MRTIKKEIQKVWTTITNTNKRSLTATKYVVSLDDDSVIVNEQEISDNTIFLSAVDTKLKGIGADGLTIEEWDSLLSAEWVETLVEKTHTTADEDFERF